MCNNDYDCTYHAYWKFEHTFLHQMTLYNYYMYSASTRKQYYTVLTCAKHRLCFNTCKRQTCFKQCSRICIVHRYTFLTRPNIKQHHQTCKPLFRDAFEKNKMLQIAHILKVVRNKGIHPYIISYELRNAHVT